MRNEGRSKTAEVARKEKCMNKCVKLRRCLQIECDERIGKSGWRGDAERVHGTLPSVLLPNHPRWSL